MEETVFSKIIRREIPADIVYENEDVLAFLDVKPNHPGHTLVIPKSYARNIFDIEETVWHKVMDAVRLLAPIVRDVVKADGVNISMNNEPAAGQVVFHAHVHIIPRFKNDMGYSGAHSYSETERADLVQKIRAALPKA